MSVALPSRARTDPGTVAESIRAHWTPRSYVVLAVVGAVLGLLRGEAAIDTDSLWSARYGVDLLASGRLPRSDTYSWTAHGSQWIPSSWLWNVALGGSYDLGGVSGIWVLALIVTAGLGLAIGYAASRLQAGAVPTAMVFGVLGIFTLVVSPRAQLVSNILGLLMIVLLPRALFAAQRPAVARIALLVLIQGLWMNLHTVALIGPPLLLVSGAAIVLRNDDRRRRATAARRLALLTAGTSVACLATPYGWEPIVHAAAVRQASVGLINEWDPAGFASEAQVIALVSVVIGAALAIHAWRSGRPGYAAALSVLAIATASAVRFTPMIATFIIPELALLVGGLSVRRSRLRVFLGVECGALIALVATHLGSFGGLSAAEASPQLVHRLPQGCRVVNDYSMGGVIILLRPDVQVSVDGRNDMYGRARVMVAIDLLRDVPGSQQRMRDAQVNCVLATSTAPLVTDLEHSPGWAVIGKDGERTLLVRTEES